MTITKTDLLFVYSCYHYHFQEVEDHSRLVGSHVDTRYINRHNVQKGKSSSSIVECTSSNNNFNSAFS